MEFDKKYTNYWASTVDKSIDGTVIAGAAQIARIFSYLGLQKKSYDRLLDCGCSYGRLYQTLADYSDQIFGIDPDGFAVEQAQNFAYKSVDKGTAEAIPFMDNFFDCVFMWAVFDTVDHLKGLLEINRVLKIGGHCLLTGKNDNYIPNDKLAFDAEKNAYLKAFPNKFTDLPVLLHCFNMLGFELDRLLIFSRRGDLGLLKYIDLGATIQDNYLGYEYVLLFHKISDSKPISNLLDINLYSRHSKTANAIALQNGFCGSKELFEAEEKNE